MSINNNSGNAIKAGIWYTISNFLAKGLVFLSTPIFTRVLTTSQYGEYSNFATWQNLLLILVTLQLYSTIARAKFDFEKDINRYISTITLTGTLFTMFCYSLVICFMSFFSNLFGLEPIYIHMMFLYLLTAPALQIVQAKHRVFMRYKFSTLLTLLSSVGSIMAAIGMVYLAQDKLFGRIFGQEIVLIICNTCLFVWIIVKGRGFDKRYCKYALAVAAPLIPHLLAGNLLGSFDKIVIKKICGEEDLALYSLAFTCSLLAGVLWESLNQAMVPWLYENITAENNKVIKKVSKYYIALFMCVALGIMLFVPEVIYLFGGTSYAAAKYVMPPVIMSACFQFAYSMYVNIEMYNKKTISIAIGTLCAAGLNIPLNYIFVAKYGYVAAAYTTMFCYGLLMIFHYITVRRMKMSYIYNNKFNLLLLSIMCVVTLLMVNVYRFERLRRCLIIAYLGVFLFVFIKNRIQILKFIKRYLRTH